MPDCRTAWNLDLIATFYSKFAYGIQTQVLGGNAIEHLTKHCGRLDYASARRGGYHIGSGAIESANKMICHGRLKRTGAWWYPSCANNILKLRCAKYNGTYDRVIALYRERHPIKAVRQGKKKDSPGNDSDP